MNREQWKALQHEVRADARLMRQVHGGWPCITKRFRHGGVEWVVSCSHDMTRVETEVWTLLRNVRGAWHADQLVAAATFRRLARVTRADRRMQGKLHALAAVLRARDIRLGIA